LFSSAPDGLLLGQHPHDNTPLGIASGRPPQQSNDVKQQILAAKYDSESNRIVFLVGGSAGGTHALWAALDPNPSVPSWSSAEFPRAVVGLSGVYDLSLREPPPSQIVILDIDNYTNTMEDDEGHAYQYSVSPIALVAAATNIPPIRLYATEDDPVPHQQAENMRTALQLKGADVLEWTIPGTNLHAFNYWHTMNPFTGQYVSVEVINFLKSHLP